MNVLRGVWRRNDSATTAQFIQNPAVLLPELESWLTWFPPESGRSALKTLHYIHGGQCYLIQLEPEGEDIQFEVTGRTVIKPLRWQANAYTLAGLCVDPASPPVFSDYFSSSPAHAGSDIRRLDSATGIWVPVDPSETIQRGEAYWIAANDVSSYQGPACVETEGRGFLDFGVAVLERPLLLENETDDAVEFVIKNLLEPVSDSSAGGLALSVFDDWSGAGDPELFLWRDLTETGLSIVVNAGLSRRVRIAVRRRDMAGQGKDKPFRSLIDIRSDQGTCYIVGAQASGFPSEEDPRRWSGLWVGYARIFQVQQVTEDADPVPKDTSSEAVLRLIVHVDSEGNANLLRECIVMWLQGTTDGEGVVVEPGQVIGFSDADAIDSWKTANPDLADRLTGVTEREGVTIGRRISSVGFCFANPQSLMGMFGAGVVKTLDSISTSPADDLNPYRHRYHPDHENGLSIEREITFDFSTQVGDLGAFDTIANQERGPDVALGDLELSGTYSEMIKGIYRSSVELVGEFRLRRMVGEITFIQ